MDPLKILIVDDSLTIRAMLEAILGREPKFSIVGIAATGEEALAMVARFLPDIILLDLQLPELDGIGFMDAIHGHWHKVHVIVISSSAVKDSEQCRQAFMHGAEACFNKARIVQAGPELIALVLELGGKGTRRTAHKGDAVTLPPKAAGTAVVVAADKDA